MQIIMLKKIILKLLNTVFYISYALKITVKPKAINFERITQGKYRLNNQNMSR